ncbi:MAG TPA: hypothetical protein VHB27_18640 [Rhodopila sp.]|uniref:hypothetical protein n=1 Tax=Rhodopila sp. TaxID=2480087 RepID=UPI002BF1ACF2|nr:hypothetical protein [Rhodopila sp.]HVY17249.1 hypothetical protein [Rhodopila sp.]
MGNDLTPAQVKALHRLAGIMIPEDAGYGVPAANDPAILADIVKSLGRDRDAVVAALDALGGAAFDDLPDAEAQARAMAFLSQGGPVVSGLSRAVLRCYYRDDRVLVSVGHEARAPFPKGHVVEQGDWSLLDPVRQRAPLWRDDRPGHRRA